MTDKITFARIGGVIVGCENILNSEKTESQIALAKMLAYNRIREIMLESNGNMLDSEGNILKAALYAKRRENAEDGGD